MPCDLGRSWAKIYGNSVRWLENTSMSMQPMYLLCIYIERNQNRINNVALMSNGGALIETIKEPIKAVYWDVHTTNLTSVS